MIDIHSHLLPGVDDGARTFEVSARVLARFAADGVEAVVCTPHLLASQVGSAPIERHREILAELRNHLPEAPALLLGWEIMLDVPGADLTPRWLGLGGSRAVLVEFPRTGIPPRALAEFRRLRASGIVPVLAHPERYVGCSASHVREWRSAGVAIQCDAAIFGGDGSVSRLARTLLLEGLIDCIASDNHGDRRSLAVAREWLLDLGADEAAELLTAVNPGRLIHDETPAPVPPVRVSAGAFAVLKALLIGRS